MTICKVCLHRKVPEDMCKGQRTNWCKACNAERMRQWRERTGHNERRRLEWRDPAFKESREFQAAYLEELKPLMEAAQQEARRRARERLGTPPDVEDLA